MHPSWQTFLQSEFQKDYFKDLADFLKRSYATTTVFPAKQQVFRAFTSDLNAVKVVILGQDPYHTPNTAMGLAFSVQRGQKLPPSLKNIYQEIDQDVGAHHNQDGDLSPWQQQGVMLLNNVLTVEAHQAGSHRQKGWEIFTQATIEYLNENRPHLVFLLWGRDARAKKTLIDQNKHLILEAPHPSPLSAHSGFFGCKHFSKTNQQLVDWGLSPILW